MLNGTTTDLIPWAIVLSLCVAFSWAVFKLQTSKSEGARRLKTVLRVVALLIAGYVLIALFGIGGALMILAVAATIIWIVRGFKNKT